jgi:hypothetical protein
MSTRSNSKSARKISRSMRCGLIPGSATNASDDPSAVSSGARRIIAKEKRSAEIDSRHGFDCHLFLNLVRSLTWSAAAQL